MGYAEGKAMTQLRSALFLALLSVLCGQLPAAETRDLLLIAGQSNAVGYDAKPPESPQRA